MRRSAITVLIMAAASLGLGAASAWPEEGFPGVLSVAGRSCVLLAVLAVFFLVLPKRLSQPVQILVGMVSGVAAGWLLAKAGMREFVAGYVAIPGTLFILLLKMVIVPLVFASIVCGVAGIGDVRKLGSLGIKTLAYYLTTTAGAVLIGLCCVNAVRPGVGQEHIQLEQAGVVEGHVSLGEKVQKDVLPYLVQNPVMANTPILTVILFAMMLGAALAANPDKGRAPLKVFEGIDAAMVTLVMWIMLLAPVGVFALMAKAVAAMGLEYIAALAKYVGTVVLGLALHFSVLVCVLAPVLGRVSPLRFLRGISPALQLAFSTSSSSATLPVTIDCAARRVGVSRNICSFVLPLGATVNMDGTALYQAVAALFIAQVYGMHLGLAQQFLVFATAITVSIGAAGIPGASVGMMSIVLASAGIPIEGVGIVLGVDRFLDMCRTVVNVTGDCVGAVVVGRSEGAVDDGVKPS